MIVQQLKSRLINIRKFFSSRRSFSQHAEDLVLDSFLPLSKKRGFYVDIGAHHPVRFSNTLFYYKRGWRGINIDAMPGSMKWFNILRRRDINLEMGAGLNQSLLKFYSFREPAFNTFSDHLVNDQEFLKKVPLKKVYDVPVYPLSEIFEKYLPANTTIDFMNIDCEGLDFDVLKGNNWELYRPHYLLVEERKEMNSPTEIENYLITKRYHIVARLYITSIYKADEYEDT